MTAKKTKKTKPTKYRDGDTKFKAPPNKTDGVLQHILESFDGPTTENKLIDALDNLGDRINIGFTHLVSALTSSQATLARVLDEMRLLRPKDQPVRADGLYDVVLLSPGQLKIHAIKAIREFTGLGLREAKDLVDAAPSIVLKGVSREKAEQCTQALRENGAIVRVDGGCPCRLCNALRNVMIPGRPQESDDSMLLAVIEKRLAELKKPQVRPDKGPENGVIKCAAYQNAAPPPEPTCPAAASTPGVPVVKECVACGACDCATDEGPKTEGPKTEGPTGWEEG